MQVPTLDSQVRPQAAPNFQERPLRSTGLEELGQGLANVGHVLGQIKKEEQLKADRTAFMEADRNADTVANDLYVQAQSKTLKDAIGITPKALEEYDKKTSVEEGKLKTDRQKLAFRESVYQKRSQLQRSIEGHEASQRAAYEDKSREDYKTQAHLNAVTYYQDPRRVEEEIDKIRATVDQTPGIDAEQKATELGIRRSGVYAGVIDRYLSNDQVKQADAYYKGIKSKVNGDKAADIERAILSAKQRMEAERKAKLTELRQTLGDQLRDISVAAEMGIPIKGIPPKHLLQAVFGDHEGAQHYETAQKMANLSGVVANMHDMSAADLIATAQGGVSAGPGMLEQGNIDLAHRPVVHNKDGTISTVRSMSANIDGKEVLLPTVSEDGRILTNEEAIAQYRKTGKHLGKFKTPAAATAYAERLHDAQETYYGPPREVSGAAEQAQLNQFVGNRAAQIIELRNKDPAGYLAQNSPAVREAWTAFQEAGDDASRAAYLKTVRAERERLQIPGDDVLPNGYADAVADQINTADAQKLASLIERESAKWGADWPAVQGQLAGKISDSAAVISSGIARGAAVQLAATANLKEAELKALLPPGTKWNDVQEAVDDKFSSFSASLPTEAASTWNAFRESATRLSVQYMHQGMSQKNAVKKAYGDLVRDQIVEFRSAPFRVPPSEDKALIEIGARQAVEQFSASTGSVIPTGGAFTAEEYQGQLQDYVHENGYWVTRPDAKGLRLYVDGGPVAGAGGPVEYTWAQLAAFGETGKAKALKVREDQIRALEQR